MAVAIDGYPVRTTPCLSHAVINNILATCTNDQPIRRKKQDRVYIRTADDRMDRRYTHRAFRRMCHYIAPANKCTHLQQYNGNTRGVDLPDPDTQSTLCHRYRPTTLLVRDPDDQTLSATTTATPDYSCDSDRSISRWPHCIICSCGNNQCSHLTIQVRRIKYSLQFTVLAIGWLCIYYIACILWGIFWWVAS